MARGVHTRHHVAPLGQDLILHNNYGQRIML
jgi:hypothetical protein